MNKIEKWKIEKESDLQLRHFYVHFLGQSIFVHSGNFLPFYTSVTYDCVLWGGI